MSAKCLRMDIEVAFEGRQIAVAQTLTLAGVTAIFGPSGAGKSTLLRAIAGFEGKARGTIALDDEVWLESAAGVNARPHRRAVGFVFQDRRLFSHLSVAGNLAFAEKRRTRAGITLDDVTDAFDLAALLDRDPATLSGGESQRVALACALLTGPSLLLLDEPLSALDHAAKARILPYIAAIYERFGIPSLYVSHDADEVTALAEQTLTLAEGRVLSCGPTEQILGALDRRYFERVREAGSVLSGQVAGHDFTHQLTEIVLRPLSTGGADAEPGLSLRVPLQPGLQAGARTGLHIRADDVSLALERPRAISIRNILQGEIIAIRPDPVGAFAEVEVQLRAGRLRSRLTKAALADLSLQAGQPVYALIKTVSLDPPLI